MAEVISSSSLDDPRHVVPGVLEVLESGLGRLHAGAQVYVSRNGEAVADFGFGEARPGVAMTPDTMTPLLSAGKPLTAAAVLQLWESGDIGLEAPVAGWIPEFGTGGKDAVTLRHLLTHTSGFPNVDTGWPAAPWEESLRRIDAVALDAPPGTVAAYHFLSSWFVLGELLARVDGIAFPEAFARRVCRPLGLANTWCGMPDDAWHAGEDKIGGLFQRQKSGLELSEWHTRLWCTAPSPGGNCRGPMRELGRFYESLLGFGNARVLQPETVAAMTSRVRKGMYDETLQHVVDFGLGVIVDSNRYGAETVPYGFGRFCSERAFGHGGSQCSMGFADPQHGLVAAWGANGRPGEPQHQKRNRAINEALYRDLGLASPA